MLTIALETSSRPASLAGTHGEASFAVVLEGDRAHASDLVPAVSEQLERLGAPPRDLELVVVGTGPGSYTGLRVGVATALGIARGAEADLVAVPSFEARAFLALQPGEEATVLEDARGGAVYGATYRRTEGGLEELTAPCVLPRSELEQRLDLRGILVADQAALRAAALTHEPRELRPTEPTADVLLRIGVQRYESMGPTAERDVRPLYLRAFEARARRR